MLLHRSGSPSRNTRSHGTNTLSKKAKASISSKREPRGWSNVERPRSKLSRHRNFRPGASQGMAKAKEVRPGAPVGSRWERAGYTAISSAMGQGRQQPRPVDHDAGVSLLDHRQGNVGLVGQGSVLRGAVALQVDQRMCKHQVVFPHVLVIVLYVSS